MDSAESSVWYHLFDEILNPDWGSNSDEHAGFLEKNKIIQYTSIRSGATPVLLFGEKKDDEEEEEERAGTELSMYTVFALSVEHHAVCVILYTDTGGTTFVTVVNSGLGIDEHHSRCKMPDNSQGYNLWRTRKLTEDLSKFKRNIRYNTTTLEHLYGFVDSYSKETEFSFFTKEAATKFNNVREEREDMKGFMHSSMRFTFHFAGDKLFTQDQLSGSCAWYSLYWTTLAIVTKEQGADAGASFMVHMTELCAKKWKELFEEDSVMQEFKHHRNIPKLYKLICAIYYRYIQAEYEDILGIKDIYADLQTQTNLATSNLGKFRGFGEMTQTYRSVPSLASTAHETVIGRLIQLERNRSDEIIEELDEIIKELNEIMPPIGTLDRNKNQPVMIATPVIPNLPFSTEELARAALRLTFRASKYGDKTVVTNGVVLASAVGHTADHKAYENCLNMILEKLPEKCGLPSKATGGGNYHTITDKMAADEQKDAGLDMTWFVSASLCEELAAVRSGAALGNIHFLKNNYARLTRTELDTYVITGVRNCIQQNKPIPTGLVDFLCAHHKYEKFSVRHEYSEYIDNTVRGIVSQDITIQEAANAIRDMFLVHGEDMIMIPEELKDSIVLKEDGFHIGEGGPYQYMSSICPFGVSLFNMLFGSQADMTFTRGGSWAGYYPGDLVLCYYLNGQLLFDSGFAVLQLKLKNVLDNNGRDMFIEEMWLNGYKVHLTGYEHMLAFAPQTNLNLIVEHKGTLKLVSLYHRSAGVSYDLKPITSKEQAVRCTLAVPFHPNGLMPKTNAKEWKQLLQLYEDCGPPLCLQYMLPRHSFKKHGFLWLPHPSAVTTPRDYERKSLAIRLPGVDHLLKELITNTPGNATLAQLQVPSELRLSKEDVDRFNAQTATCAFVPDTQYKRMRVLNAVDTELKTMYKTALEDVSRILVTLKTEPTCLPRFLLNHAEPFVRMSRVKRVRSNVARLVALATTDTLECGDMREVHEIYDDIQQTTDDVGVFELVTGITPRQDQLRAVEDMTRTPAAVRQLLMGKGKSSVITPLLLSHYHEQPTQVVVPSHLLRQAHDDHLQLIALLGLTRASICTDNEAKKRFLADVTKEDRDTVYIYDEFDMMYNAQASQFNQILGKPTQAISAADIEAFVNSEDGIISSLTEDQQYTIQTLVADVDYGVDAQHRHHRFVVPFLRKDSPMHGAQFSDVQVAAALTTRYWFKTYLGREDVEKLARNLYNSDTPCLGLDPTSERPYRDIDEFAAAVWKKYDTFVRQPKPYADLLAFHRPVAEDYLRRVVLPSITQSNSIRNSSFIDILARGAHRIGFSGTVNIDLKKLSDANPLGQVPPVAAEPVVDPDEVLHVHAAIMQVSEPDNLPIQFASEARDVFAMLSPDCCCLIDAAALFKDWSNEEIIDKVLTQQAHSTKLGVFLSPTDVKLCKRAGKESTPFEPHNLANGKQFYYYSQKNLVGVDLKQPRKLTGCILITPTTTYTVLAQAMFRMRKLNRGHRVQIVMVAPPGHTLKHLREPSALIKHVRHMDAKERQGRQVLLALQIFKQVVRSYHVQQSRREHRTATAAEHRAACDDWARRMYTEKAVSEHLFNLTFSTPRILEALQAMCIGTMSDGIPITKDSVQTQYNSMWGEPMFTNAVNMLLATDHEHMQRGVDAPALPQIEVEQEQEAEQEEERNVAKEVVYRAPHDACRVHTLRFVPGRETSAPGAVAIAPNTYASTSYFTSNPWAGRRYVAFLREPSDTPIFVTSADLPWMWNRHPIYSESLRLVNDSAHPTAPATRKVDNTWSVFFPRYVTTDAPHPITPLGDLARRVVRNQSGTEDHVRHLFNKGENSEKFAVYLRKSITEGTRESLGDFWDTQRRIGPDTVHETMVTKRPMVALANSKREPTAPIVLHGALDIHRSTYAKEDTSWKRRLREREHTVVDDIQFESEPSTAAGATMSRLRSRLWSMLP